MDSSEADEYHAAASVVLERLRDYLARSQAGEGPAVGMAPAGEIAQRLRLGHWIEQGGMTVDTLGEFLADYLAYTTRLHHPAYLAHQVATPDYPAALADMIHGATNNPMALYEMGPAGATIERAVINWMLGKVGWPPEPQTGGTVIDGNHAAGVLTHGGSLANLTALLAARATVAPRAWEEGVPANLALLVPPGSHYSIARAAGIMGLGAHAIRHIDVNALEVIEPDRLPSALRRLRDDGKQCAALVANACATSTGLHDPIEEIAAFCEEEGIWLHVDACHGASALLSSRERHWLRGIERADSLVWDAHKMLRTSALCAAVLFRDARAFERAFHQEASYLFYGDDTGRVDLMPRAVECTKAGLGLKVFMNLALRGERALAGYVEDRYAITRRFHDIIAARGGFECPYFPETNILCFRYRGDDEHQVAIRERLLRAGNFHLSSTIVNGTRYLRLAVMSPHTSERTIFELLDAIESVGATV